MKKRLLNWIIQKIANYYFYKWIRTKEQKYLFEYLNMIDYKDIP